MHEKDKGFEKADIQRPKDNGTNDGIVQANRTAEGIAPNRDTRQTPNKPLPEKNQKTGERNLLD